MIVEQKTLCLMNHNIDININNIDINISKNIIIEKNVFQIIMINFYCDWI